jgi:ABC-2 type transport system ATP-binding protein
MSASNEVGAALRGVEKRRGEFRLGPLNLELPKGYVTGFVGANGAGKTTTMGILLGLITPDAGTVERPALNDIGVVLDEPFIVREWTIAEAATALSPFYSNWDSDLLTRLLRHFGLRDSQHIKELSRGQKQKLGVALAMAHNPDLLICDEPTSGLDPAARVEVVDLFRQYMVGEGRTLLFSTHITGDLEHLADFIAVIDAGQIVFWGTREDLLSGYVMARGGLSDLNADNRILIRGLRVTPMGFEGLIRADQTAGFGPSVLIEEANLDQIVAHLSGGLNDMQGSLA